MSFFSDLFSKIAGLFHRHHKDQPNVTPTPVPAPVVPAPVVAGPVEAPAPVVPHVVVPVAPSPVPSPPPVVQPPVVVVATHPAPPAASLPPTSMEMAVRVARAKAFGYNSPDYQNLLNEYGASEFAQLMNLYSEQGNWGGAGIPFELSSQIRAYMLSHTSPRDFT